MSPATILGIESSCDDTAASVCRDGEVLSNVVASQQVHAEFGGVVPELASRAHQVNIWPVVETALKRAEVLKEELSAVACTLGPGLAGPLLVGSSFAKGIALGRDIPLISVNHMEAHIHAHFIDDPKPTFPFLCLTVSGGHTQIVMVEDHFKMKLIGQTLDDAAGEAFDKSAKLLGLPYPGGHLIDKYAKEGSPRFPFPHPKVGGYDYSFSGLKTAILYFIRDEKEKDVEFVQKNLHDLCASIQERIVSILLHKLKKAARELKTENIAVAGGVSANSGLRQALKLMAKKEGWNTFVPEMQYCTDNAAMIAMSGYFKYLRKDFSSLDVVPDARMKIGL